MPYHMNVRCTKEKEFNTQEYYFVSTGFSFIEVTNYCAYEPPSFCYLLDCVGCGSAGVDVSPFHSFVHLFIHFSIFLSLVCYAQHVLLIY